MDGRVVSYQGRAGSCGSTIPAKGLRAARGRNGSVVVLAWCYPHPPRVAVGWGDRYAVPSPVLHYATRTYITLQRQRKEEIVIGDAIVSEVDGGTCSTGVCDVPTVSRIKCFKVFASSYNQLNCGVRRSYTRFVKNDEKQITITEEYIYIIF